jgi:NADPH:quinone reductase
VPGLEVAGTVGALGSGVSALEVGDRVTAFTDHGGLAEVAVAPAELTVRVPAALDLERAAAAPGARRGASRVGG